jgi:hypothetical protein
VFRRKRTPRERGASGAFASVLEEVERAKEAVVAAVPSARAPGRPLAEAVFEFEARLDAAQAGMDAWRGDAVATEWEACRGGITEARARAERLRLEAPELGFESLLAAIQELIDPLDVFEQAAARAFRR